MAAGFQEVAAVVAPPATESQQCRAWRVLHVCETLGDVIPLIEGQLAANMRPSLVTPEGSLLPETCLERFRQEKPHPVSLLTAWSDVRQWRNSMLAADPRGNAEIVHSHSFASGMAAVRNRPTVVYDVVTFVEMAAAEAAQDAPGAWLSRSFRVAEQFVISRAAAVVVHADSMRQAVLDRGGRAENLFCIPAPLSHELTDACAAFPSPQRESPVEFFVPDVSASTFGTMNRAALRTVLAALSLVAIEVKGVTVILEGDADANLPAHDLGEGVSLVADPTGIGFRLRTNASSQSANVTIRLANAIDRERNLAASDVVIVPGAQSDDAALLAMAYGRPLLAGDAGGSRDISPHGQGCLWYRADDADDLARRASFLARNREFRRVLGESGRRHLLETRSPLAVAQQYDAVYRHAFAQRKNSGATPP
jgi:Glycosyl transferase 4-like domain/Glycosyl transferases group 1